MCRTKMAVNASEPTHQTTTSTDSPRRRSSSITTTTRSPRTPKTPSTSGIGLDTSTSSSYYSFPTSSTSTTTTTLSSLSSFRTSLSQNPNIYDISEIRSATNNFLSKRQSSSTPCWRCTLREADTIVFQRKFRRPYEASELKLRLSVICRSHHMSVINLLGASISSDYIYLVYQFVPGGNLSECLRNPRNPNFTVLSTWQSRMQIATDVAHALDYIHNKTGLDVVMVHNHIKSSSIIVTEPSFNTKISHFGAALLCGEVMEVAEISKNKQLVDEIDRDDDAVQGSISSSQGAKLKLKLKRSNSSLMQFEGVRGYMSPEYQSTGIATQKSDVYAFGVVLLELLSGEEPMKFKFDKSRGDFVRTSVIETAAAAIGGDAGDGMALRRWIDRRLKDSFPVDVALKLTRLALDCVNVDLHMRPDMGRVAGKISRLYLESQKWSNSFTASDQISVSLAPR